MKRRWMTCMMLLLLYILSACGAPPQIATVTPSRIPYPTATMTLSPTPSQPGATLAPPTLLFGHKDNIQDIAFNPVGNMLASTSCQYKACLQSEVRLWDLTNPGSFTQIGATLQTDIDNGKHLTFSHDGKLLALGGCSSINNSTCTQGIIRLWDVSNPKGSIKYADLVGHPSAIHSLIFSPDDKTLISASSPTMTVIVWDLSALDWDAPEANSAARVNETSTTQVVSAQEFSPDGKLLVLSDSTNAISLWNMADTKNITSLGVSMKGHQDAVFSLAVSPDGKTLASGGLDNAIILWDISHPDAPTQLSNTPQQGFAQCLSFSPDGKYLASCINKSVVLWDVSNPQKPVQAGELFVSIYVDCAAFSADGKTLVSGATSGDLAVWDLSELKEGNVPHRQVSTATSTPTVTPTFGQPPTLTPNPSGSTAMAVYSHPKAPNLVFIYNANLWQLDLSTQQPTKFLKHRTIPTCRVDFFPSNTPVPSEKLYTLRIGNRNWGVAEYKADASFWQADFVLNLTDFGDFNCRRDQEIILSSLLTRNEYAGGATITPVPTATPRPPLAGFDCPGASPPRMRVLDFVSVIADTLWLMSSPTQDETARVTGFFKYDASFITVIEGPVCNNGYVYWKVNVNQNGKYTTGWLTESHGDEYYIEPFYEGW